MTPEEIEARIRSENPFFTASEDGVTYTISPDEFPEWYEEMVLERVAWEIEAQSREEEEAAWRQTITQFTNGKTELAADLAFIDAAIIGNTNLTQPQIKKGFKDILQSLIWLAERIEDGTIVIRKP